MRPAGFRRKLIDWYERNRRDLPWRRSSDPYRIWISEIMLQQTRVAAVIPYYERFLERFPDVGALAAAPEQDLLAAWSGLGYYFRARNLQKAARIIVAAGAFPRDYETIRSLPGVGDYTAAAIASIGFQLPHAVIDGNALRVLSRLYNDAGDVGSLSTRRRYSGRANELLDRRRPGVFNQALMELGATLCMPRQPACDGCPVAAYCQARAAGTQGQLPVKLRRVAPVQLERTLLVIQRDGRVALRQRPEGSSLMPGFWELPEAELLPRARLGPKTGEFRHTITNHHYLFHVVPATLTRLTKGLRWVAMNELCELPVSTTTKKALRCLQV